MSNWLTIELTSRCNKACYFCGRAKARKEGTMRTGNMTMEIFDRILSQFKGSIIQFNKDGEPLLYPELKEIGIKCRKYITNIVTNGILLWDRKDELKDFTTITVSVFEDDVEQFNNVKRFVENLKTPKVYIKFLGSYNNPAYESLGLITTRRSIHNPQGDTGYTQSKPVIPELGICLDFLTKPSFDFEGNMFICNRYDPEHKGKIGNIKTDTIEWMWNSPLRQLWLEYHKLGSRYKIPLCNTCQYWGYPANG